MKRSDRIKQLLRYSRELLAQEAASGRIDNKYETPVKVVEIPSKVVRPFEMVGKLIVNENPEGGSDASEAELIETDSESSEGG